MKTVICCIAKCENRYLQEWVDYHLSLGFSQIFIWDNNNPDGEHPEDVLHDYSQVTVLNCRGEKAFQNKAYTKFYHEYGTKYDWIAFIDVDEFITFSEESHLNTIDAFLSRYNDDVQIVHLNWMCYGDDEVVGLDRFDVVTRFLHPLPFDKHIQYDFPENNHVKSIIRGGIEIGDLQITVHTPRDGNFIVFDADGRPCPNDYYHPYTFKTAYIRHFVTKTIGEWLLKIAKGNVTSIAATELYSIDRFFLYNERTTEKVKVVRDYLFFKEAIEQSAATELTIYKMELERMKKQLAIYENNLSNLYKSKWYRMKQILFSIKKNV